MGKTALLEWLFNITFNKNDGVIPFDYEIKKNDVRMVDFCKDFFFTFIYQYIAFKTRKIQYLIPVEESDFEKVKQVSQEEEQNKTAALEQEAEQACLFRFLKQEAGARSGFCIGPFPPSFTLSL